MDSKDEYRAAGKQIGMEPSRVFDDDDEASKGHIYDDSVHARVKEWYARQRAQHHHRVMNFGPFDWIGLFLPVVKWVRNYRFREYIIGDVAAGISVGLMVVPQSISYATIADLLPAFGLYSAFVPVIIYACLGSSPQLAVGPVAIASLLVATTINKIVELPVALQEDLPKFPKTSSSNPNPCSTEQHPNISCADLEAIYGGVAIQLSLLVSFLYFAIFIFQLSFLTSFLSHAVISGFTSGAATIIASQQLKYFFGVKIPNTNTFISTCIALNKVVPDGHNYRTMLMFAFFLVLLLALKAVARRVKRLAWLKAIGPITVVILGIIIVVAGGYQDGDHIPLVSKIPSGLPKSTVGRWKGLGNQFGKKMVGALVVMLVGFVESLSIAKVLARRGKYKIEVPREVFALGCANFMGSIFGAYPAVGSFSRSAVSFDIGSKTQLFAIISAVIVGFTLLFLTPVLERLPTASIGAIVTSACIGIFEGHEAIFLYKANSPDFLVWCGAFFGTFFAGAEIGLAIAIGLAVLIVIYQSAFPHTATLGRLPGTTVFRSTKQYPTAIQPQGIVVIRVDAPIYFANVEWVRVRAEEYLERARMDASVAPIRFVILDLSPVPFIDATGMHALLDLASGLKDEGVQLALANPCSSVKAHLSRVHLLEAIGKEWIFVRTSDAVDVCSQEILNSSGKTLEDVEGKPVSESIELSVPPTSARPKSPRAYSTAA